jgi:hypothetical protein
MVVRVRRPRGTLLLAAVLCGLTGGPARADISPATVIDGPSADVIDVGGAAMAEDGTGGIVYRRRDEGRAHIFVARFTGGRWQPPQRVDTGQRFDSSWPVIGAAVGGRLVVVWVQEFGAGTDRLFSASLDPGATRFQAPIPIDFNVGEATATYPSLAMNRGGQAYLAYRYLPDIEPDPRLPPGYVNADVRVQRYNGALWSQLGQPADRNATAPVATPTAANSPKVGIDVTGGGIVAFQEPDDEFVDRVWARRIFGGTFGIPLIVSPQSWGDKPLRGPADQFDLRDSGFGQAAVVFRQQPGQESALSSPRVMLSTIPEQFSDASGKFGPARIVDGGGDAGPSGTPGRPSVASISSGFFLTALGVGNATVVVGGDDGSVSDPERVDDGSGGVAPDPVVDLAAIGRSPGAAVVAWKTGRGGRGGVGIQERRGDGVKTARTVSTPVGGRIVDLRLGGSGLGDALIAFQQGTDSGAQVAAAAVDAPPYPPAVNTPEDFVRSDRVTLTWEPSQSAITGVHYRVQVDDEPVADDLTRTRLVLTKGQLDESVHEITVVAIDGTGQEAESEPAALKIDRTAPRARVRARKKRRAEVVVTDGSRSQTAGVDLDRTTMAWGDGKRTRGKTRATHAYRHAGRFTVTIKTRDMAGNTRTIKARVTVR